MMKSSSISIVVPIYNGEKYIINLLPILKEIHSTLSVEVFFVDSSSSDNSLELLNSYGFENIHIISGLKFDHGGTRTMIGKMCSGDIIIYLTQDALPLDICSIKKITTVFKDDLIGAAFGRQLPYKQSNLFGKHLRKFNYGVQSYIRDINDKDLYGIKTAFLSNSFAAYRRSSMEEIGWFKDGLILGEDTYAGAMLLKKGYKLAYVSDAQVYHSHSYTILEEFKRYFDIGVFHNMEIWILDEFGKPEGEGVRYVKSELNYLFKHNAYYLFPEFIVRNVMKYLGYKLGRNFEFLPKNVVMKFSMHHRWWNKYFKEAL